MRVLLAAFGIALASILLVVPVACSQLAEGTIQLNGSTTVPFKLSGNHIYVLAKVDGKPFAFIFDSGGAATLSVAAQKELGLKVTGYAQIAGAGNAVTSAGIAIVPQFRVGGLTYSNGAFVYLPPIPLISPFRNVPFGGIFGREIFGKLVTTIDYEKSDLTFAQPASFSAPAGARSLALAIRQGGLPDVTASIDGHSGAFDVDAGAAQALTVTKDFADKTNLESDFPKIVHMEVGRGVGGAMMGEAGRGRLFVLGSYQFKNLPIAVSGEGVFANDDFDGDIGSEILRRFTVTFDVPDAKLYLTRNGNFSAPFGVNRAGMFLFPAGDGWTVDTVTPAGPAAGAGIQAGDAVISMNGQSPRVLGTEGVRAILYGAAGSAVRMQLRHAGKRYSANFVLRDLF